MIEGFSNINEAQFEVTKDAIGWITALIAGADGNIDREETAWAEKLTKIRSYANPNRLTPFYKEVGIDFHDKLEALLSGLPIGQKEREEVLTAKLAQLNNVLPLLDPTTAYELYRSYLSFAKHVAKQTGGFLGFFSIDKEEESLIHLGMITPIEIEEEEEE
jgi:hypothetical protein